MSLTCRTECKQTLTTTIAEIYQKSKNEKCTKVITLPTRHIVTNNMKIDDFL